MKNTQFKINLILKSGKVQSFRKKKDGWEQTSTAGRLHPATAEQVLNHMLPVLAKKKKNVTLEVKYYKGKNSTAKK
jgi:hypothetical protein